MARSRCAAALVAALAAVVFTLMRAPRAQDVGLAAPRLERVQAFAVGGGVAHAVEYAPNGALLASGGEEGDLILWDLATRTPRWSRDASDHWIGALRFSPDGQTLACMGRDLTVWSVGGERLHRRAAGGPAGLAWSDDGTLLAYHSGRGVVNVLSAEGYELVRSFNREERYPINALVFSPSGDVVYAGDNVGAVWRMGMADRSERVLYRHDGDGTSRHAVRQVGWLDGELASASWSGEVRIGERKVTHGETLFRAVIDRAGWLLTGGPEELVLWSAAGDRVGQLTLPASIASIAVAPARNRFAIATSAGGIGVHRLDPAGGIELEFELAGHPSRAKILAFSPDGSLLAAAGEHTAFVALDGPSRVTVPGRLAIGPGPRDGQFLALAKEQIEVVDGRTTEVLQRIPLPDQAGSHARELYLGADRDTLLFGGNFFGAPRRAVLSSGTVADLPGYGRLLDAAFHPRDGRTALGRVSGNHGESG